jgi:hypothetical protein
MEPFLTLSSTVFKTEKIDHGVYCLYTDKERLRWGDSVDYDVRVSGQRNWRNSVLNMEEWRKLLKKAGQVLYRALEPMMI